MSARIWIRRAYEPASANDGYRVLVDRVWPRGVSKETARLDEWARELAPSNDLAGSDGDGVRQLPRL